MLDPKYQIPDYRLASYSLKDNARAYGMNLFLELLSADAGSPRYSQEIALLDFCKTTGRLDLQSAIDILEIPRRTAQRWLSRLINKGLLMRKGNGKNIYYVII